MRLRSVSATRNESVYALLTSYFLFLYRAYARAHLTTEPQRLPFHPF